MKTKKILHELLDLLDSFEHTVANAEEMSLEAFLTYVLSLRLDKQQTHISNTPTSDEATIAQMLSLLYRLSRHYTKRALQESLLQSEEEYTYLVSLLGNNAMSKTELNTRNALERTTGNEMLKRLLRAELISELENPEDRRQRLVQITPKGKQELAKVFPRLKEVVALLSWGLDDGQKLYLRNILSQMASQHLELNRELRHAPLEEYIKRCRD